MKLSRIKVSLLFSAMLISALALSCSPSRKYLEKNKPVLKIENVSANSVDIEETKGSISVSIKNRYDFPLPLSVIDLSVYLEDGAHLADVVNSNDIVIPAKSTITADFPFTLKNKKFVDSFEELMKKDKIHLKLKGEAAFKHKFISFSIPLEKDLYYEVPPLPEIDLASYKVRKFDIFGSSLKISFTAELKVSEKLDVKVKKVKYKLYLSGTLVSQSDEKDGGINVDNLKDGNMRFDVNVSVNLRQVKRLAKDILDDGAFKYKFEFVTIYETSDGKTKKIEEVKDGAVNLGM